MSTNDIPNEPQWHTCCSGTTEKSFVKYMVQVVLALVLIIFSMIQIARGTQNMNVYYSLISMTIGIFFPNPKFDQAPKAQAGQSPSLPASEVVE